MATTSLTRSLRRPATWLLGSLAAPILAFLAAAQPMKPPGAATAPSSVSAGRAPQDVATIEFVWPKELTRESCLLVFGSLDQAATRTTITIDAGSGTNLGVKPEPEESVSRREPRGSRVQLASWNAPRRTDIEFQSELKPASRVFFLQSAPQQHRPVTTRLAAKSGLVRIWEDDAGDGSTSPAELSWLIKNFEDDILPRLVDLYGAIADVDGDGTLAICLTDRLRDLPAHDSPVEGLVQAHDFHVDLPRPHSNQSDVLFLSRTLRPGPQALAVLAHEAAHLAVFSRRFETDPHGFRPEDDWLNEGLAHFAEVHCSGSRTNLAARIAAYRKDPESSPLVVIDAHREGFWRHPGSRGAAWSFLAWISDEYGPDAVPELARHPDVGRAKIESVLQRPFAEIFRRYTTSQAIENSSAPGGRDERRFTLYGTTYHSRRLHREKTSAAGWRIEVPAGRQLQVTLVDSTTSPPRLWIVR